MVCLLATILMRLVPKNHLYRRDEQFCCVGTDNIITFSLVK